jgi:hypothetical protein
VTEEERIADELQKTYWASDAHEGSGPWQGPEDRLRIWVDVARRARDLWRADA